MISAHDALKRLQDGNLRFVEDVRDDGILNNSQRRHSLISSQEPFAIILGCSDSRVPAELVFDQGLGDLFVIRVAGNIVAPSQVGSVEFAAMEFGTRLVVVMGHSSCGAVSATVDALEQPSASGSPNLASIVERVQPSVETVLGLGLDLDRSALIEKAVRENVRASADYLRTASPILKGLIEREGLLVVGSEYSLETGVVDFFDGLPD